MDPNPPLITLKSIDVEFECKSQDPPGCPETIEVELHMPQGNTCFKESTVTVKFDGREAEGALKMTLKGKVVTSPK